MGNYVWVVTTCGDFYPARITTRCFQLNERGVWLLFKMEGTCNECVFPLNKEESEGVCATDTSLVYAASKGKLSCVKELIAAGAYVNSVCECHGNGALLSAAMEGRVDCLHELIISGTQVNVQNNKGNTTLMITADRGHVECLKELISAGIDINKQNKDGRTALMFAAGQGHVVK